MIIWSGKSSTVIIWSVSQVWLFLYIMWSGKSDLVIIIWSGKSDVVVIFRSGVFILAYSD